MTVLPSMAFGTCQEVTFWASPSWPEDPDVGLGEDEVLDELLALAKEHVLGAVRADALGAVVSGELRVGGCRRWRGRQSRGRERDPCGPRLPSRGWSQVAAELRTNRGHLTCG